MQRVIVGKPEVVRLALVTLLAEGHLLVEDVPGVGKTSLAKALARSIDCSVSRVQFTPDLLPGDITGMSIFNRQTAEFEFRPGPVFANVVIADEINRASPKTQSALLECMAEHQVTVDGSTYQLASPFLVVATQNPIEMDGTYPLPEAQRDRFTARVSVGYPDPAAELAMVDEHAAGDPLASAAARSPTPGQVRAAIDAVRRVQVSHEVRQYCVELVGGHPPAPGAAARRLAPGDPAAGARGPGAGRAVRARLRGARRRAGGGGAGAGAPAAAAPGRRRRPSHGRRHRARPARSAAGAGPGPARLRSGADPDRAGRRPQHPRPMPAGRRRRDGGLRGAARRTRPAPDRRLRRGAAAARAAAGGPDPAGGAGPAHGASRPG